MRLPCYAGMFPYPALCVIACCQCIIMAGGGVTPDNVAELIAQTSVIEVHATARAALASGMVYRKDPPVYMGGEKVKAAC